MFREKALQLTSDPQFLRYQNLISEPNFFKIVGQTHTERWHSSFWGWLIDPPGSHGLNDYVLTRLLYVLLNDNTVKPANYRFLSFLPIDSIIEINVRPNEQDSTEVNVRGVGRFDIYIDAVILTKEQEQIKLNIIIELKVDSPTKASQSKKYADWQQSEMNDHENVLIYFLPNIPNGSSSLSTVGDDRWYCVSYQQLHDSILMPCISHPNLSEEAELIISQYIKNMRLSHKGIKMATTKDEKDLAIYLYEKYQDVFDTIIDVLTNEEWIEVAPIQSHSYYGRSTGRIAVRFNDVEFEGSSSRTLLENVLKYIVDNGLIKKIPLPWGTGTKRYIVTDQIPPIHPNDREFFSPVTHKNYSIETHLDRNRCIKVLQETAEKLGVDFALIEK